MVVRIVLIEDRDAYDNGKDIFNHAKAQILHRDKDYAHLWSQFSHILNQQ